MVMYFCFQLILLFFSGLIRRIDVFVLRKHICLITAKVKCIDQYFAYSQWYESTERVALLHYCGILHICRHCESSLFRGRGCLADGLGLGKDIAINRSSMTCCELEPMAEPGAAPNEVEGAEGSPHNLLPCTSIQANRPKPHGCPQAMLTGNDLQSSPSIWGRSQRSRGHTGPPPMLLYVKESLLESTSAP